MTLSKKMLAENQVTAENNKLIENNKLKIVTNYRPKSDSQNEIPENRMMDCNVAHVCNDNIAF